NGAAQRPAADNANAIHFNPFAARGRDGPLGRIPTTKQHSPADCGETTAQECFSSAGRSGSAAVFCSSTLTGWARPRACCLRRLRPLPALWQGSAHYAACFPRSRAFVARCRSSVVEHSLGKGEVVSSILTGSTTYVHHAVCAASAASSDG